MPWTHASVGRRLKLLGVLGIVGGLMAASAVVAQAQQPTEFEPQFKQLGSTESAGFEYESGLALDMPGSFFEEHDVGGSVFLHPRSLLYYGQETFEGSVMVQAIGLAPEQAQPELIAPNPGKPAGVVSTYLGRAVLVSVDLDFTDDYDPVRFNPPMVLNLELTEEEWAQADGDPNAFVVRAWEPNKGVWLTLDTSTDPFESVVAANVTRPGHFALFLESPAPAVQGGDVALGSMALLFVVMGGLALIIVGATIARGASLRRAG